VASIQIPFHPHIELCLFIHPERTNLFPEVMAEVNPKAALTSSGPHPKSQDSLLGLSATYRPPNVPCKVQDELGLDSPGPYAPPSSPSRLTETGNDLQNVDDPESLSRYLSEFSFGQLSSPAPHTPPDSPGLPVLLQILTSGGDTEIEEEKARAFNGGFEIVDEMYVSWTQGKDMC
jgi:hypothetical protein